MTDAKDGSGDPLGLGDGTGEPKPRRARGAAKRAAGGDDVPAAAKDEASSPEVDDVDEVEDDDAGLDIMADDDSDSADSDTTDGDTEDSDAEDSDDEVAEDDEREKVGAGASARRAARRSTSSAAPKSVSGKAARTDDSKVTARRDGREERVNVFARIWRYYREIVAELRKVIWPTRRELVTYTTVVVIFVAIIVALVAGLDYVFAKAVLKVFG